MASTELEIRKAEISATVEEIISLERALLAKGIDTRDYGERAEALSIIARIERRMLANTPKPTPQRQEAS